MKSKTEGYSAGEFRDPVIVETPTDTPNGSGGTDRTWATLMTIYCSVEYKKAWERFVDSARIRTEATWSFTTWYRPGILETMRLNWKGKIWNIRSVEDIQSRGKFLRIVAEAGVET